MKELIKKLESNKSLIAIGLMFLLSCVIIIRQRQNHDLMLEMLNRKDTVTVLLCDTNCVQEVILPNNFNYAYTRLRVYNSRIDTSTVLKFLEVAKEYCLDDVETLRWGIGQLLLESGGKQFTRDGGVVLSSTGAIGMGQILGSTGLDMMRRRLSIDDEATFYKLGASDFSFAYDKRYTKKEKVLMSKKWLAIENNNLIMWGYIMRNNINKKKTIISALISYNVGIGGLHNFLRGGKKGYEHEYIVLIRQRINYVEKALNGLSS